jgi:hypothetical protein
LKKIIFFIVTLHFCSYSQVNIKSNESLLNWQNIDSSFEILNIPHLRKSIVGDGLITLLKIDSKKFNFDLIEYNKNNKYENAQFWIDSFNYSIIANAGMYNLKNEKIHRFYMKNNGIVNNLVLDKEAKSIIAFNPLKDSSNSFAMFDLEKTMFNSINEEYNTIIQGYRLIDFKGQPVYWERVTQYCSMLVIAQDIDEYIYLIFSRSPLTHNQMIENLISLKINFKGAMYIEGGAKASLTASSKGFLLKKMGSYVSNYHPFDDNLTLQKAPNFIGFKLK